MAQILLDTLIFVLVNLINVVLLTIDFTIPYSVIVIYLYAHMHMHVGVVCNPQCPEEILFGELTSNSWHVGIKIFIALLIISLGIICVIAKIMFVVWLYRLEKKLKDYLESLDSELESPDYATLQVKLYGPPFCSL